MRPYWVAIGLSVGVPSALLAHYLKTTTWAEVVGYRTYAHQFNPIMWMAFAAVSVIAFLVMALGIGLEDASWRTRRGHSICPQCGAPRRSRFCQNCGARFQ